LLARDFARDERNGADNVIRKEFDCDALRIGNKRFKVTVILRPE